MIYICMRMNIRAAKYCIGVELNFDRHVIGHHLIKYKDFDKFKTCRLFTGL